MATITRAQTTIVPDLVLGWDSTRETRSVVHQPLDGDAPSVTVRPAALRSGTLTLFFTDLAAAAHAELEHAEPGPWTLALPEAPDLAMRYVVAGAVTLRDDGDDRQRWQLSVGFQEVTA